MVEVDVVRQIVDADLPNRGLPEAALSRTGWSLAISGSNLLVQFMQTSVDGIAAWAASKTVVAVAVVHADFADVQLVAYGPAARGVADGAAGLG
ncbi:MAG: hypothetical protein R3F30_05680 [Planctomycetota bacterium]